MKSRIACLAAILGVALVLSPTEKAQAIPAFARLYKTECNTCHTIFPDRNPFGDAFRKNSYVWPGNLPAQMEEGVQYTPPEGKGGEREWMVTIPDQVPISFWVNHDFIVNKDKVPQIDLDGETELEVFTAGNFRGKAGWWAEYNFAPDREIGEVYLQFRKVFGSPVNVKAGRFKPRLSLWKSNDSATISSYGYNDMVVGLNPPVPQDQLDAAGATIGNPFTIDREQGGVELNSVIGNRIFAAAGVVTPPEKDHNGVDYYGHLSVRIGGTDFNGSAPAISLVRESLWDNLALTFGTFYYYGGSQNVLNNIDTNFQTVKFSNNFYRLGAESEVLYKNLRLRMNAIFGQDDNPRGAGGKSETSRFYMGQGQYIFMRNILGAMRFEYQDIEREGITRRYIPTVVYAPWQNVRLALEYVHEIQPKFTQPHFINREYTARVTFAY
ncbi:MAG TPA: hypothetical protein VI298_08225 [Geobacteraceae bacterium]